MRGASSRLAGARAVAGKHLRVFVRSPMEGVATLFMPVLWLLLFGVALESVLSGRLPGVETNYIGFLAPGMVALTAVTASLFAGGTFFLEVDRGEARQYLAAPMARWEYYAGLGASSMVKTVIQGVVIVALAVPLGMAGVRWVGLVVALVVVGLFALGAFGVSVWLARKSPSFEAYHSLLILLNVPLLFVSDALYPLEALPSGLYWAAVANPLTHLVEALRFLMVGEASPLGLLVNGLVLGGFAVVGAALGARAVDELAR